MRDESGFGIPDVWNGLFNSVLKSTNREIEEKNVIKGEKNMPLIEIELQGTSRAENLYFAWSLWNEYGFGILRV